MAKTSILKTKSLIEAESIQKDLGKPPVAIEGKNPSTYVFEVPADYVVPSERKAKEAEDKSKGKK